MVYYLTTFICFSDDCETMHNPNNLHYTNILKKHRLLKFEYDIGKYLFCVSLYFLQNQNENWAKLLVPAMYLRFYISSP